MDDIERAQQLAFDAVLRNALAVERNNRGLVADMNDAVGNAGRTLGMELLERLDNLAPGELRTLSRYRSGQRVDRLPTRVQGVVKFLDEWAASLGSTIMSTWQDGAIEFTQSESDFIVDLMRETLVDAPAATISAAAVYKQAMETPALGIFIEDALKEVGSETKARVISRIREGVTQGETTDQIVRALRGTKSMNYSDGVMKTTRNNLQAIVRTGRTHLANTSYDETYQALGVEQVVFVATIDGRTTLRCSSLDSNTYNIGSNYPRPPLHYGCRSIIAPYFGGRIAGNRPYVKAFRPIRQIPKDKRPDDMVGQVRASTSMTDFLKRSDNAAFAREYFGPTRYKLFQEGKISISQMIRADGTKYTIAELRQRHAKDFREVFGDAA
ncbi:minor capsid protein [Vreelandella aquamarina]|uniref:minor capsid protein n=1 Tax=Vreelandella aquamarina TaxID=77097 RepID=UPI00078043C9|nr:minor capsid protein [Halomonas axialensis]